MSVKSLKKSRQPPAVKAYGVASGLISSPLTPRKFCIRFRPTTCWITLSVHTMWVVRSSGINIMSVSPLFSTTRLAACGS